MESPSKSLSPNESSRLSGAYFLTCPYCYWNSLEIGIQFEKPNNITGQLSRIRNGGVIVPAPKERERIRDKRLEAVDENGAGRNGAFPSIKLEKVEEALNPPSQPDSDELFSNLNAFYKSRIKGNLGSDFFGTHKDLYRSPSSVTRIMSLYGSGGGAKRSKEETPSPMREPKNSDEGLNVFNEQDEKEVINQLKVQGWNSTTSVVQRSIQIQASSPRFLAHIRPVATLLRTKRSKRCRDCRHILVRPEAKIQSQHYKIRLLALNNIPRITLDFSTRSTVNPSFSASCSLPPNIVQPLEPMHLVLTLRNPLYDSIHVTLATTAHILGRNGSRITLFTPQFRVGANTDVWNEALDANAHSTSAAANSPSWFAEAGKVLSGRNWTSVGVEVVPDLRDAIVANPAKNDAAHAVAGTTYYHGIGDADILEIAIFFRIEYETEAIADGGDRTRIDSGSPLRLTDKEQSGMEKREDSFWCVFGIGKIGKASCEES